MLWCLLRFPFRSEALAPQLLGVWAVDDSPLNLSQGIAFDGSGGRTLPKVIPPPRGQLVSNGLLILGVGGLYKGQVPLYQLVTLLKAIPVPEALGKLAEAFGMTAWQINFSICPTLLPSLPVVLGITPQ